MTEQQDKIISNFGSWLDNIFEFSAERYIAKEIMREVNEDSTFGEIEKEFKKMYDYVFYNFSYISLKSFPKIQYDDGATKELYAKSDTVEVTVALYEYELVAIVYKLNPLTNKNVYTKSAEEIINVIREYGRQGT